MPDLRLLQVGDPHNVMWITHAYEYPENYAIEKEKSLCSLFGNLSDRSLLRKKNQKNFFRRKGSSVFTFSVCLSVCVCVCVCVCLRFQRVVSPVDHATIRNRDLLF